jgi:toxin ParE1/3/4
VKVRYHLEAVEEYDHAVSYYAAINPTLAARFIDEVERIVASVAQNPQQGPEVGPNIRVRSTQIFPYRLIYFAEGGSVTVLAVAHDKREPDYWVSRAS